MKAVTYQDYGSPDDLKLEEIEKPVVTDDDVLIKVHAASVSPIDWHFLTGTPVMARMMAGLFKPKYPVLGSDLSGQVEAVGANVTQLQPGDEVFGLSFAMGGFAEYLCAPQSELRLVLKPDNVPFDEAAAVPNAGYTALNGLYHLGDIQSGQKVLINGASGGVGTFAVQMAKAAGAEVTGVCSTTNLDFVRSLGADHVIDYTQDDFTQIGERYDLIFDVAAKRSFSDCRRVLADRGIYVTTEFSPALVQQGLWVSITGSQRLVPMALKKPQQQDFQTLSDMLAAGQLSPVIESRCPLADVPDTLRRIEAGHVRGKIVVVIQ